MMQYDTLSSRSAAKTPTLSGGIPPFNNRTATGVDLMTTQSAAELLAARIIQVWSLEGHSVDAWVFELDTPPNGFNRGARAAWGVQTDLVNGMPSGLGRAKWERKFGRGI